MRQPVRQPNVVSIQKGEKLALNGRNAKVARGTDTAIDYTGMGQHANAVRLPCGVAAQN